MACSDGGLNITRLPGAEAFAGLTSLPTVVETAPGLTINATPR